MPMRESILFLFMVVAITINAQDGWELRHDKEGIKVYTRHVEGSNFKEFKGETRMNASISALAAVFIDVAGMVDWIYNLREVRLLEEQGDTMQVLYQETNVPWPFQNRDGIYSNSIRWDREKKLMRVDVGCHPDYLEEVKGKIRTLKATGYWEFKPGQDGSVHTVFCLHTEPGGSIPAWLSNTFVINAPLETMKKLKIVAGQEKYQNRRFSFLP